MAQTNWTAPTHSTEPSYSIVPDPSMAQNNWTAPTHLTVPTYSIVLYHSLSMALTTWKSPIHSTAPTYSMAKTHSIAPTFLMAKTHSMAPTHLIATIQPPTHWIEYIFNLYFFNKIYIRNLNLLYNHTLWLALYFTWILGK